MYWHIEYQLFFIFCYIFESSERVISSTGKGKDQENSNTRNSVRVTRGTNKIQVKRQLEFYYHEKQNENLRNETQKEFSVVNTKIAQLNATLLDNHSKALSNFQDILDQVGSINLETRKVTANLKKMEASQNQFQEFVLAEMAKIKEKSIKSPSLSVNNNRKFSERENHTCSTDTDCSYWRYCTPTKWCHERSYRTLNASGVGRTFSLLDQDGSCGGVVYGDEGYISFKPDPTRANTEFTCIWTIRANLYEKVAFKLIQGDVVESNKDAILFVAPLKAYILNDASASESLHAESSKTISNTNIQYIVDGPVVFLTLVANSSSSFSPNFQLSFVGQGDKTSSEKKYRHYHFDESEGELDYPRIRGTEKYSNNEISTFVINPHPPSVLLNLLKVDLETESTCKYDALTFLNRYGSTNYFKETGNAKYWKDGRYCMSNTYLNDGAFTTHQKAYIVTFTSDSSYNQTGFKFSWK